MKGNERKSRYGITNWMGGSEVFLARRRQKTSEIRIRAENVIKTRFHWQRPVWLILFLLAALAVAIFGFRTYRSFLLLHSAYELGAPDVSSVRPWMTLDYVARTPPRL
jgi:hypothetical protein